MISRRNFLSMTLMMAALFFLFQFSQIMKEQENDYDTNEYVGGIDIVMGDYWRSGEMHFASGDFVVFVGNQEGEYYRVVSQWCQYTKRNLVTFETMSDFSKEDGIRPEAVFVDVGKLSLWPDINLFRKYMQKDGLSFVAANLPSPNVIRQSDALMEVLGIAEVVETETELSGIHLFEGLLLGGEAIYEVKEEDKEKQDLNFAVPWYRTAYNTKTYMMGILEDEELDNEQLPALVWRNSVGEGRMYAINGEYMQGVLGMGILSGIMADLKSYELYPVVNARNVTVANMGGFSRENHDRLYSLYSRDQAGLMQTIILPDLLAMMEQCSARPTYFLSPQYDYEDDILPTADNYVYYMQQINEQRGEAGWSMEAKPGTSLKKKAAEDGRFRAGLRDQYSFSAVYMPEEYLEELPEVKGDTLLADMRTISVKQEDSGSLQVLSLYDDGITLQSITNTAEKHTYLDDLRLKAVETVLGYSNMLIDMNMLLWPRSSDEQWEILGDNISRNLYTYWRAYDYFDATTLSESDARLRRFMKMDYVHEREGDVITIQVSGVDGEISFVLRTHGEEIESAQGATFKKMERDAWLVCARGSEVTLHMRRSKQGVD